MPASIMPSTRAASSSGSTSAVQITRYDGYPSLQCRVDTLVAGAQCGVKHTGTVIPGLMAPYGEFSYPSEAAARPLRGGLAGAAHRTAPRAPARRHERRDCRASGVRRPLASRLQSPSTSPTRRRVNQRRFPMIRTKMMMLAFGALSLTGVSAMAATKTAHHMTKTNNAAVVAQAEGGDAAKPADEGKTDTKKAKKSKGAKKAKAGSEAAPAPAPETK